MPKGGDRGGFHTLLLEENYFFSRARIQDPPLSPPFHTVFHTPHPGRGEGGIGFDPPPRKSCCNDEKGIGERR